MWAPHINLVRELAHVSPLMHGHVIPNGTYRFDQGESTLALEHILTYLQEKHLHPTTGSLLPSAEVLIEPRWPKRKSRRGWLMRLTGHALAFLARLPAGCKWRLLVRYNQFQRFLPPGHAPYQCPGGILHLDIRESPMMLARALWFYEPRKVGMLQKILRSGMTFVDVGANHGYFTTLGARLVGQSGRVISIEPEPRNSSWILKAVRANHYQNVSIHQVAAGAATGEALLHLGANSGFHSLVGNADGKVITVRRVRLDDIIRRADAIKIDVEGAELQVLQGAQRLLSTSKVVLVEVHPQLGVDCDEVGRFLRDRGFVVELDGADITATHKGMAKGDATSMTA